MWNGRYSDGARDTKVPMYLKFAITILYKTNFNRKWYELGAAPEEEKRQGEMSTEERD